MARLWMWQLSSLSHGQFSGSVCLRNTRLMSFLIPSRNGVRLALSEDPSIIQRVEASVETLQDYLSKGYYLYGK
jgi:hypothetical protein